MNDSLNQDVQRPFFDTNVYTGFDKWIRCN